jgi:hypothetical protein
MYKERIVLPSAGPSKKQKFAYDGNELSPADLAIVEEVSCYRC